MAEEIERKFLVEKRDWNKLAHGTLYRQGYLSSDKARTVRVRIAGERAFLTVKGPTSGIARSEFEYAIPTEDARALLDLCERPLIEKTRYVIEHAGRAWEVDVFHGDNDGLVVAEVELQSATDEVTPPDWVREEVSSDPRYFNSSLVKRPYKSW